MKSRRRITDIREYSHSEDRLEGVEILERHFPEIGIGEVRKVTVEHSEGYAVVKVYRYAKVSTTDPGRYVDKTTGEVAMLPVVVKTFPASGLLSP